MDKDSRNACVASAASAIAVVMAVRHCTSHRRLPVLRRTSALRAHPCLLDNARLAAFDRAAAGTSCKSTAASGSSPAVTATAVAAVFEDDSEDDSEASTAGSTSSSEVATPRGLWHVTAPGVTENQGIHRLSAAPGTVFAAARFQERLCRAEAFEIYIVCSTLFAGVGLQAVLTDMSEEISLRGVQLSLFVAHQVLMTVCAILGIYASVIFAMCSLYAKTALSSRSGRLADGFLASTAHQRKCAFFAFLASGGGIVLDLGVLMVSLLLRLGTPPACVAVLIPVLAAVVFPMMWHTWHVLALGKDVMHDAFVFWQRCQQ